jgi:hypothetical protein
MNLNEHISRMKNLFSAEHGIIKPLVSEQKHQGDEPRERRLQPCVCNGHHVRRHLCGRHVRVIYRPLNTRLLPLLIVVIGIDYQFTFVHFFGTVCS